jgi:hypothetical protein
MMYQRDALLNDLRKNVIEVTFTKTNGEQRIMRCTLMENMLPATYKTNPDEKASESDFHQKNKDVIAAWDVQAGGWRSFRIDSATYVQVIDSY